MKLETKKINRQQEAILENSANSATSKFNHVFMNTEACFLYPLNAYFNKLKLLYLSLFVFLIMSNQSNAQETEFKRTSIRTGIGIGYNEGKRETGMGLIYSIGWQKSFGKKNKLRLNPNLIIGIFLPNGFTDTRFQFYRITSLCMNLHYDLIKYKSISIVTTGGGFLNYSRGPRGLLGTGGWSEANNNSLEYFTSLYFGGNFSYGIRINPKNSRLAYEFRPINVQLGNDDYFILFYLMFGIDIKI